MSVREPFFAYQGWYPSSPESCRQAVREYLDSFPGSPKGSLAGIVPHAGWVFSGRTAGLTFAALADAAPDLVFIFGGHMHPGQRCICMPTGAYGTPVGDVPVHEAIASELSSHFSCQEETPERFQPDNTIELQMPFIHEVWPRAKVVAVQVPPDETAEAVGLWAADKAKEQNAVAIGSTDLTHYGANYGFSPKGSGDEAHRWSKEENDRPFIDRLLKLDYMSAIDHAMANHSACCAGAAAAAAAFAKARGATAGKLIEHVTSHEVESRGRPRPSMWVGYASIVY